MARTTIWHRYQGNNEHVWNFQREHGCERSVQDGGYFYYETGAFRGSGVYGQLEPPPSDPVERQQVIIRFWERIALPKAVECFDYFKENEARWNYADEEVVATLKSLQREVKLCRRKAEEAKGELLRLHYGVESVEEARRMKAENDQRAAEDAERIRDEERTRRDAVRAIKI